MSLDKFQLDDIQLLHGRMAPYVRRTPLLPSHLREEVSLKAENLQNTHSFKVRAAAGQILALSPQEMRSGLVTSSSGNFGQAAAMVCNRLEIPLTVVMTRNSNPHKVRLTEGWGAEVAFCENSLQARQGMVQQIAADLERTQIHPFNHPNAILGNASLALEVLEQLPLVQNVVVPVSGGGLISGVALGIKMLAPHVRVWGVQPQGSSAAYLSFQKGEVCELKRTETIADGLRANRPGDLTFAMIKRHVDDMLLVSEAGILRAVESLLLSEKLLIEPSGAIAMAAILEGLVPSQGTVAVLSGGNIDPDLLGQVVGDSLGH